MGGTVSVNVPTYLALCTCHALYYSHTAFSPFWRTMMQCPHSDKTGSACHCEQTQQQRVSLLNSKKCSMISSLTSDTAGNIMTVWTWQQILAIKLMGWTISRFVSRPFKEKDIQGSSKTYAFKPELNPTAKPNMKDGHSLAADAGMPPAGVRYSHASSRTTNRRQLCSDHNKLLLYNQYMQTLA